MAACVYRRLTSLGLRTVSVAFRGVTAPKCHVRCFSASVKLLSERKYTEKHEWVLIDQGTGTVGISDYAQEQLGEVVYVELPEVGKDLSKDDEIGTLESVKAASEVYTPMSGTVTDTNKLLEDQPNLINESPLDKGWLYKLKLSNPDEAKGLMDEAAYKKFTSD